MYSATVLGLLGAFAAFSQAATMQKRDASVFTTQDLYREDWEVEAHDSDLKKLDMDDFAFPDSTLEQLADLQKQLTGDNDLVIIPTKNGRKVQTIQGVKSHKVKFVVTPVDSEVGEQPYNEAGPQGGKNRIRNALALFLKGDFKVVTGEVIASEKYAKTALDYCREEKIGNIHVVSIENYMKGEFQSIESVDEPKDDRFTSNKQNRKMKAVVESIEPKGQYEFTTTLERSLLNDVVDFGAATGLNLGKGEGYSLVGGGFRVPRPLMTDLVKWAMSKGFDESMVKRNLGYNKHMPNEYKLYGLVTVGTIISMTVKPDPVVKALGGEVAKYHGLSDNWHWYVANKDRSESALKKMQGPDRWSVLEKAVSKLGGVLF